MRVSKLIPIVFLAVAPLMVAACGSSDDGGITGSAVEDPSKPGDPGSPVDPSKPGEPSNPSVPGQPGAPAVPPADKNAPAPVAGGVTLESFIAGLPPTQRVDIHDMEKACGTSTVCTEQLATFTSYVKANICAAEAGCVEPVGLILYKTRSASQERDGNYPASFPQAKAVAEVLAQALAQESEGSTGGDVAAYADTLQSVADELAAKAGTQVDTDGIAAMITAKDAANGEAAVTAFKTAVSSITSGDASVTEAAATLGKGGEVDAAAAADVIKAVIEGDSADSGGGSAEPGAMKSVSETVRGVADALAAQAGTKVDWQTVAGDLGTEAADAVKNMVDAGTAPAGTEALSDLVAGKEADAGDVATALTALAAGMK